MLRSLALSVLILAATASAATGAPVRAPTGWTMEAGDAPKACAIDGPVSGDARLSFATDSALLFLVVTSPKLPRERTEGAVKVRIDGGDWTPMPATAAANAAGISIGGRFADSVAKASRIAIWSALGTWTFDVRNVGEALDAVTTCAGEPTLAQRDADAPKPIAGAHGWLLLDRLPDSPGRCSARLNGKDVDTMIMNPAPDGTFVLLAGRTDWATLGGEAEIGLSVDGGSPQRLKAYALQNLVLVGIKDATFARRLRRAHRLDWSLPAGRFHAEISGLGTALDAVIACEARQGSAKR